MERKKLLHLALHALPALPHVTDLLQKGLTSRDVNAQPTSSTDHGGRQEIHMHFQDPMEIKRVPSMPNISSLHVTFFFF